MKRSPWTLVLGLLLGACTDRSDDSEGTEATTSPRAPLSGDTLEGFGAGALGGDGTGAATATVTSLADAGEGSLRAILAAASGPTRVVFGVEGTITLASSILPPSHVTIDGGGQITVEGQGFHLVDVEDLVFRDLRFHRILGPGDAITIERSHTVAVVHCDFDNEGLDPSLPDEFISVVWGSTDVTIAWSRFANSDKVFLFGNGDAPAETDEVIRVTLHDNALIGNGRRHPFVRFGQVDEYNSLISGWGLRHVMTYGVRAADGARVRLENNWFEQESDEVALGVDCALALQLAGSPWIGACTETDDARIDAINNVVNGDHLVIDDDASSFERPYEATLQVLDAQWRSEIEGVVGVRISGG
jgi:pectate lyase